MNYSDIYIKAINIKCCLFDFLHTSYTFKFKWLSFLTS